jgi:hypothetical protein
MSTKLDFEYQYEIGRIRSTVFHIGVRADPNLRNVESFAAILFFRLEDGTVVEVAKVDNAEHDEGTIHVDRYYRESSARDKDFDTDIEDVYDADEYLENNWRHFAQTYLQNHGQSANRE